MRWRNALLFAGGAAHWLMSQPSRMIASRTFASKASHDVDSMILRSLNDYYLKVKRVDPPLEDNPPSPYEVVKGALECGGPVLKRTFKDEEIRVTAMYPDAVGIHSLLLRPKEETYASICAPSKYDGPVFYDLDEEIRNALHSYIEARPVPFLQALVHVKVHREFLFWFKTAGTFVSNCHQEIEKA